jgi:hypothetical protein
LAEIPLRCTHVANEKKTITNRNTCQKFKPKKGQYQTSLFLYSNTADISTN